MAWSQFQLLVVDPSAAWVANGKPVCIEERTARFLPPQPAPWVYRVVVRQRCSTRHCCWTSVMNAPRSTEDALETRTPRTYAPVTMRESRCQRPADNATPARGPEPAWPSRGVMGRGDGGRFDGAGCGRVLTPTCTPFVRNQLVSSYNYMVLT